MNLPYQIQRTELAHHGDDAYYRFDLVCTATGAVLVSGGGSKATAPMWMVKRLWELNVKGSGEIKGCK